MALTLTALPNKGAWYLLGHLCLAIGRYGKPQAIRTDNEALFKSRTFRCGLAALGIRQQFTQLGKPWQNGRIERLFGTLKAKLDQIIPRDRQALQALLIEFQLWYNVIRPHQHLGDRTPYEVWFAVNTRQEPKEIVQFNAWEGRLRGYWIRR